MKKVIVIMLISLGVFGLTACGDNNTEGMLTMVDFRDPDTGVHYWKYTAGGITVRYNADGTVMVD